MRPGSTRLVGSYLHRALTMGLVAVVGYLGLTHRRAERSAGSKPTTESSASTAESNSEIRSRPSPSAEHEFASLRRALLRQVLSADVNAASPSPPPQSPLALAQATLDQRMMSSAPNSHEATRLEGILRPLLEPAILGEATAELHCGVTLCKVMLIAEDDAGVARAAIQLSDRLPKTFSNVVVYPDSSGRRALYLSTNRADLELTPAQNVVAQEGTRDD